VHDSLNLDQRLGDLQSQLDRLAELTRRCAEIVTQWSSTGERQARAVGQFEEQVSAFSAVEERLHHEALDRLRALERSLEQEWSALRQLHAGPAEELREQAAALGQLSVAAANRSIAGFDRADARLSQIERALEERLDGMSRQIDAAVADIRALASARATDVPGTAWPIEGVMRLHNQLRESAEGQAAAARGGDAGAHAVDVPPPVSAPPLALPPAPEIAARLDSVEQALSDRNEELQAIAGQSRQNRVVMLAVAGAAVLAIALAGIAGVVLQRQARAAAARATEAQQQAQAAVTAAQAQVNAAREDAARQVAQARDSATRAQVVGDVLASPDLVRFNISGAGPGAVAGQVLWSRSRGVVFSGVRLPALPANMTYQLWLLTDGLPVNGGTFAPDESGRVTFTGTAPRIPRAVTGAALTLEPAGGSQVPSDRLLGQKRTLRPES
jgi:hypothetical protein